MVLKSPFFDWAANRQLLISRAASANKHFMRLMVDQPRFILMPE